MATYRYPVSAPIPKLCVLGELVVDLLPVPGADAGPGGTAPQYVARPGGNALNVAVAGSIAMFHARARLSRDGGRIPQ